MAADKDNSNNYADNNENLGNTGDAGVFDDEKELEKYGVWVKTGPEEIDDIEEDSDFNLSDLEEESIITEEEEEMLGELEKELSQDDIGITERITDLTESIDDSEIDLDLDDLDEIELDEFKSDEDVLKVESVDDSSLESFDLDIDFNDDLNPLDEESVTEDQSSIDKPGDDISDTSNFELEDLDLEDLELDESDKITPDDDLTLESSADISTDVEELDMDMLLDNMDEDILDDLDVDLLLEEDVDELLPDGDENPDKIESELNEMSEEDVELVDFNEELEEITESDLEEAEVLESGLNNETNLTISDLEEDFDETERIIEDLTDLDDLEEPTFESPQESESSDSFENIATSNVASEILIKIEQELLSIKNELHDVKKELSTFRPDSLSESISEEQLVTDDESGFFEEDEDETIALTGDELDNILNTADITEETGSESESPEELLQIDGSGVDSNEDGLLIDNEDIITIEEDSELNIVLEDEVLSEDLEIEDLLDNDIDIPGDEISPDQLEDLFEDEIIELDDADTDGLNSDESINIDEFKDSESVEEIAGDDFLTLDDLDTEDLMENIIDQAEDNIEIESLEEVQEEVEIVLDDLDTSEVTDEVVDLDFSEELTEKEIVLDDLDTEELTSDLVESVDLSDDLEFEIDDVEEIIEKNPELENMEDDQLTVVASEPDATSTIDIELPEMQEVDEITDDLKEESLTELSPQLKTEIKSVLSYMDQLLESLPEEKIDEFANSEHYEVYKKLFEELGLN